MVNSNQKERLFQIDTNHITTDSAYQKINTWSLPMSVQTATPKCLLL